jgi:hypothetical protein
MRENWILIAVTTLVGAVLLSGCAAPQRTVSLPRMPDSHIIFNPGLNTPVVAGADRNTWPSILASDSYNPESLYRETIYDRQGNSFRGDDYYFRRIDSTRIRRSGR